MSIDFGKMQEVFLAAVEHHAPDQWDAYRALAREAGAQWRCRAECAYRASDSIDVSERIVFPPALRVSRGNEAGGACLAQVLLMIAAGLVALSLAFLCEHSAHATASCPDTRKTARRA
jgi:hypothetical protein